MAGRSSKRKSATYRSSSMQAVKGAVTILLAAVRLVSDFALTVAASSSTTTDHNPHITAELLAVDNIVLFTVAVTTATL